MEIFSINIWFMQPNKNYYKFLLPMKITILLLLTCGLNVFANNTYSQTAKVTLNLKNARIEEVLNAIESKSEYYFLLNQKQVDINRRVNVDMKNTSIKEVLSSIFKNEDVSYVVYDRQIILTPKEKTFSKEIQQKKITGTVIDATTKVPLVGVTVFVEGTKKGVVTDLDGKYSIETPSSAKVLIFSYLGYNTLKVEIAQKNVIDISLIPDIKSLDEVVIVGYGKQKKATITGAISNVGAKEITTSTSGNVVNMLAGKLPGFRVTQRTGEPGDYATDFDIRGFGSPLIVIDGVPSDNFNRLDPNEIESVSVLKDASAAVYGVKGGNGVVLITTKRGGGGKTEFNFSSTFGVTAIANSPGILNAYQFATLTDEAYINGGNSPSSAPYSKAVLDQYKNGTLPSTNWFDLVVRKNSPVQQYNLSASGSTDKVKYFLSLGYYDESGIYKSGDLNANRYNFRSNITADVTKNLQAEVLINGIQDTKNAPGESTGSIFQALWSEPPTIPVYANNNPAYLSNMPDATHPISITTASYSGYNDNTTNTFNGSFALNYKIRAIDGLKARVMYAYNNSSSFNKVWKKAVNVYDYDDATKTYNLTGIRNSPTTLTQYYTQYISTTAQASLDYTKTFLSAHNVKALLLVEERKQSGTAFNGSKQYSLDAVDQLYAGNSLNQSTNSTNIDSYVNQGLVGRLNYDYKGKYLLEGSFRYDGSSKFAEGHQWGFFPAVSGGWRISEEPFLKGKASFLNNLKLRASYGKLGDDASSTYQYLSGYNYPGSNYVLGGTLVNGLGFRGLANTNLTWYTSTLANIGFDADLLNSKLHIEVDAFSKKREGLLATRNLSLPGTVGAALPQENLNSDLTKGFELTLGYHDHIGALNYNVSGNISLTRTKNLYIEQAGATNSYSNWLSNNANRWNDNYFGYKVIGQFKTMAEIKSSPVEDGNGNRNVLPGDFKYQDLNHDGIIDANDKQVVGKNSNTPEVNFGFSIALQWKGFDFSALFQGATNYTVSYLGTIALDGPLAWGRNGLSVFMDRWHTADLFDPNSAWIPGTYPSTRTKGGTTRTDNWNYLPSNFWLKDATYLRLKSIQIGYTLPAKIIGNKGFIKALRIYTNGLNLFTWSGLNSLIDPEHTNSGYGNTYPITKNYNFGVNLTF
jgi:TonB-linked SusC/RagA family outer membrane protein